MVAKLTRLTHKNSDTTVLIGRELYHLQFSLQVASPETFGYTLVMSSRISVSILERQTQADDNGWSSTWRLDERLTNSHCKRKQLVTKCYTELLVGSCEHGNELSVFIKGREFLDQLELVS
jgi:hypothetical protein